MTDLNLSATLEDYLETIYNIIAKNKVARSMEIAEILNVKRSSVTVALRSLAEKELIHYEPRSYITLTSKGFEQASCITQKHRVLNTLLKDVLGLPEKEAEDAACKMEHGMTESVCRQLSGLINAITDDELVSKKLMRNINHFAKKIDCNAKCINHTFLKG